MVRTFQLTKVFDRMTVLENLMFAGSEVSNDSLIQSIIRTPKQKEYENFEIMGETSNGMKTIRNIGDGQKQTGEDIFTVEKKYLITKNSSLKNPDSLTMVCCCCCCC